MYGFDGLTVDKTIRGSRAYAEKRLVINKDQSVDPTEQIFNCLHCQKKYCDNCAATANLRLSERDLIIVTTLSLAEAAKALNVSVRTVSRYRDLTMPSA